MTGDDFTRLRHQEGFSQHDFADLLGISRRTISNLERSDHIPPKYANRLRHLGIAVEDHSPAKNHRPPHSQSPRAYVSQSFDDDVNDEDEDFFDDDLPTIPDRISPATAETLPPFEFQTVPGNLFRAIRQKLEITLSRLVRLSGLTTSDIENAESTTTLVPPTLFESLVTASDLPTLAEPDTFVAYLSEALAKRLVEEEIKPRSFSPLPDVAGTTGGKDAAVVESTHFKWAYDRVSQELSELKTEYREVSRTAAERLEKINTLQRDLDRLTVQTELADEFSQEYAQDVALLRDQMSTESLAVSNRWNDAKATALEALPAVLPALAQIAQTFFAKPQPVYAAHAPHLPALPTPPPTLSNESCDLNETYATVNGHPPTAIPAS